MTTSSEANAAWPSEIRLKPDKTALAITFTDGMSCELSAELLRVFSPSAEVQGHSPSERKTVGGKEDVRITGVEPVGHYAIRLSFDDGHSTGIYTWAYLRELGASRDQLWQRYLEELQAKNMSRSPWKE
jgi:DUF971 family protein